MTLREQHVSRVLERTKSHSSKILSHKMSNLKRKVGEEAAQQKAPKRPRRSASTKEPVWKNPVQKKCIFNKDMNSEIKREDQGDTLHGHVVAQRKDQKAAESLLCQIYAEVEAACNDGSLALRSEELQTFIHAARVGSIYDDERAAQTIRRKNRIRDKLVEIEDAGHEHPAFATASSVLSEIRQTQNIALRRNLVEFADRFDSMLLAICAHSVNFRRFMTDDSIKTSLRDAVDRLLDQNTASLKLFARSRGLSWERLLSYHNKLFTKVAVLLNSPNGGVAVYTAEGLTHLQRQDDRRTNPETTIRLPASYGDGAGKHPHELALAADNSVTVPALQPRGESSNAPPILEKKNISESRVLPGEEYDEQRQDEWPIPDPKWRTCKEAACRVCGNRPRDDAQAAWQPSICQCTIQDLKNHLMSQEPSLFTGESVELVKADPFGIGVQALQRFRAGNLLAKAVGEIYPPEDSPEYDEYVDAGRYTTEQISVKKWRGYRQQIGRGLRLDDTNAVCQIDAAVFGNWTRYLNHSCNANTRLQQFSVGRRVLMCVRVEDDKKIGFGDVLTVNYGRQYFVGKKIACRCGEDSCQLWNEKKIGNNKKTLAEARMDGTAPDWA